VREGRYALIRPGEWSRLRLLNFRGSCRPSQILSPERGVIAGRVIQPHVVSDVVSDGRRLDERTQDFRLL
jgi:hypothetical protein